ncbi:MAG: GDSL-type esterase/lipase family protein [Armatimonadota bacterium]
MSVFQPWGAFVVIGVLAVALLGSHVAAQEAEEPYWVAPMKAVHERFQGEKGTVAQYGDSITITMAFWTPLRYEVRNCPPELEEALAAVRGYVAERCWRGWKGPEHGNEGRTTTEWGLRGIEGWLAKHEPEVALVMWGTNDTSHGPQPPQYTDNLRAIIQKCLDVGTIPILYTIPPRASQGKNERLAERVEGYVAAIREVAAEKHVPLVDFYAEIMRRQPENFGTTLMGDELHPSYPEAYRNDFSEEGLSNSGYTLRNYLTLKAYWEVHQRILSVDGRPQPGPVTFTGPGSYKGRPYVVVAASNEAPTLDGNLDDACWKGVEPLTLRRLDGDRRPPKLGTQAWLTTSATTLYVAFRCDDPDPGGLVTRDRERDGPLWEDDSVEVFLKPGEDAQQPYYHVIFNPSGSQYDGFGRDAGAWDPKLEVATGRDEEGWTVELAIPFAEMNLPEDEEILAGGWRLNLTRARPARAGAPVEESGWSPTADPSSHVPGKFGYAWFEVFGGEGPGEPR